MTVISTPSKRMDPAVGLSRPAIKPSNVDLPLPDGPTMATIWFSGTSMVISSRIVTIWPPAMRRIVRWLTVIMLPFWNSRGARRERKFYYTVCYLSGRTSFQICDEESSGDSLEAPFALELSDASRPPNQSLLHPLQRQLPARLVTASGSDSARMSPPSLVGAVSRRVTTGQKSWRLGIASQPAWESRPRSPTRFNSNGGSLM